MKKLSIKSNPPGIYLLRCVGRRGRCPLPWSLGQRLCQPSLDHEGVATPPQPHW